MNTQDRDIDELNAKYQQLKELKEKCHELIFTPSGVIERNSSSDRAEYRQKQNSNMTKFVKNKYKKRKQYKWVDMEMELKSN